MCRQSGVLDFVLCKPYPTLVCTISSGVSRSRARGSDRRRGNGPGKHAFSEQAEDDVAELERIEPQEPERFEPPFFGGFVAQPRLVGAILR